MSGVGNWGCVCCRLLSLIGVLLVRLVLHILAFLYIVISEGSANHEIFKTRFALVVVSMAGGNIAFLDLLRIVCLVWILVTIEHYTRSENIMTKHL